MADAERQVMQDPLFLVSRKVVGPVGVRYQDDHLRDASGLGHHQELVRQLRGRHQLEAEPISIEIERGLHIGDPQDDLGQALHPAHAATAVAIASRFTSRTRGDTEQPGASSSPRPPVSSTAARASAAIFGGGPYTSVARWL